MRISHHDVVVLVIVVVPSDAPHIICCLAGMIPDIAVEKCMSPPDGLMHGSLIPGFLKA